MDTTEIFEEGIGKLIKHSHQKKLTTFQLTKWAQTKYFAIFFNIFMKFMLKHRRCVGVLCKSSIIYMAGPFLIRVGGGGTSTRYSPTF